MLQKGIVFFYWILDWKVIKVKIVVNFKVLDLV